MKQAVMGLLSLVLIGAVFVAGCDIKPEQVKVIAQNVGLFSAVGWIALNYPYTNEIEVVKGLLVTIELKAADVQAGATYIEVVYPELVKIIDKDVEEQYRPVCKAASLSLLGGIDLLFATHPEWKEDQDLAIQVVDAFILGAKNGLSLKADDPRLLQAKETASKRKAVYKAAYEAKAKEKKPGFWERRRERKRKAAKK